MRLAHGVREEAAIRQDIANVTSLSLPDLEKQPRAGRHARAGRHGGLACSLEGKSLMSQLAQDKHAAQLTTPLGEDVLVLESFVATEALSELFEVNVETLSEKENIDFDKAIGKACTIKQITYDNKTRYHTGILTATRRTGSKANLYHYHLTLRPWLWLLGRRADCRIFLEKDVKQILSEVFEKAGFTENTDFEFRTNGDFPQIPYCVQYRETDLAFCSRMMEHYGIYYFFEHGDRKHLLVMANAKTSHKKIPDLPKLPFIYRQPGASRTRQHVHSWVSDRKLRTGKVHFNDYDYLKPGKDLKAPKESKEKYAHSKLEMYDYHHKYDEKDKGENHAQFRLEAEQAFDHRRSIHGDAASLHPGGLVTVEGHPTKSENQDYLIVGARHMYSSERFRSGGGGSGDTYSGSYDILPTDRPYRSLPKTPKPRIYGIQTAKVVGKKGEEKEEISTDEHGHIWVQFHWDREPQKSCPVRVAQTWAGKKWGALFLPRVGMEVVVDFIEGDPDRPLVTGCVYNGNNKPPYLPADKTVSGWKSDSSKHNGGYNEFVFDDKQDSEKIRMHAERDHEITVKHAETRTIGEKFSPSMGSPSRSTTIKNGDDQLTIESGNQTTHVKMAISTEADISITLKVGASSLSITKGSISLMSPVISLTATGALTITGAPVTVLPALNTPALLAPLVNGKPG
jgi:type VI secretion system secreted protein VgrG